ncbi:hypothetical protein K0M31_007332 [Melipona bicolor]|uniref:Uncharacterized protein n=1 Tax=Melipona bicolor TaxID=60889 RepID=A0AA40KVK7_9HYME|nr:hypothetical protein K0M31_007332 [Melipona bicolor]
MKSNSYKSSDESSKYLEDDFRIPAAIFGGTLTNRFQESLIKDENSTDIAGTLLAFPVTPTSSWPQDHVLRTFYGKL